MSIRTEGENVLQQREINGEITCPKCGSPKIHETWVHPDKVGFWCEKCDKPFVLMIKSRMEQRLEESEGKVI